MLPRQHQPRFLPIHDQPDVSPGQRRQGKQQHITQRLIQAVTTRR
jgi:hypothetical protein